MSRWHGGKGSGQRKRQVPHSQYSDNWERAFGKKHLDESPSPTEASDEKPEDEETGDERTEG